MSVGLPTHYQLRLEHISHEVSRLPRDASSTVVLLGDVHVESNEIKDLAGTHVINMGIQEDELGKDCGGLKDRLWLLPMARPSDVVIMAGLNDLRAGRNPLIVEKCFKELVAAVKRTVPSARIHIALIPPTREKYAKLMHEIAITNAILEEMAGSLGVQFVDLFSPLEDDEGQLAPIFSEDGYYLNDTGFDRINDMLEKHLSNGDSY
jgi:lysophospholipase L1-like esterase